MSGSHGTGSSATTAQGRRDQLPDVRYAAKWAALAALIGVLAGVAAAAFFWLLNQAIELFTVRIAGFHPPVPGGDPGDGASGVVPPSPWLMILVPALGGLIAGVLMHLLMPASEKSGTDAVIRAFHEGRGRLGLASPAVKAVASAAVIGAGGSVGREGPMVALGAAIGSAVGRLFKLRASERRTALLVGAAAGFASIFRAPLSGAIFAIESPYRNPEFEYSAFVPAILGAVSAFATFGFLYTTAPVFTVGSFSLGSPLELLVYAVFGLLCAATGILYVTVLNNVKDRLGGRVLKRLRLPVFLWPAAGGLLLGALACFVPQVWGTGYGWVQQALDGSLNGVWLLFGIALAKTVATGITHGSRGGEGVFGPAFFVGAMLGAGYGHLAHQLFPHVVPSAGPYILVGMGGLFAGITKVPIAGLVMVCEITGSYSLLLPLVLVCSLSYVFTGRASVYKSQVASRFDSPAHLGEMSLDVLGPLSVADAWKRRVPAQTVSQTAAIAEVLRLIPMTRHTTFPVVDANGSITGVVTVEDVRDFLFDTAIHRLVLADEVASKDFPSVTLDEPLLSALRKFAAAGCEEIPIVEESDRRKLVGLLSRDEILRLYRERVDRAMQADQTDITDAMVLSEDERPAERRL